MFSFFKKKPSLTPIVDAQDAAATLPTEPHTIGAAREAGARTGPGGAPIAEPGLLTDQASDTSPADTLTAGAAPEAPTRVEAVGKDPASRGAWLDRLRGGLKKTGQQIGSVFVSARIDDALYEELESALLMSDAGVKATAHVLQALKAKVKKEHITDVQLVKAGLVEIFADLLAPLEKPLAIGKHKPTVIMMTGVNGAGKTTSIGKLTRHLSDAGASVLLAAGDTFRAAAREQLNVWAERNSVDIVSHNGADPAAVSFDAVTAAMARGKDVVLIDTAGRLPTQTHLMQELQKIKRVIQKASDTAPHEVLLVIDGNTGQNALSQVKAFDDCIGLTGLIVTKLDGTAKGGVLAAIAMERPIPVYFVGVGESVLDLQNFKAHEFAQAMLA